MAKSRLLKNLTVERFLALYLRHGGVMVDIAQELNVSKQALYGWKRNHIKPTAKQAA